MQFSSEKKRTNPVIMPRYHGKQQQPWSKDIFCLFLCNQVADYCFFFKSEANSGFYNNIFSPFKVFSSLEKSPWPFYIKLIQFWRNLRGQNVFMLLRWKNSQYPALLPPHELSGWDYPGDVDRDACTSSQSQQELEPTSPAFTAAALVTSLLRF